MADKQLVIQVTERADCVCVCVYVRALVCVLVCMCVCACVYSCVWRWCENRQQFIVYNYALQSHSDENHVFVYKVGFPVGQAFAFLKQRSLRVLPSHISVERECLDWKGFRGDSMYVRTVL